MMTIALFVSFPPELPQKKSDKSMKAEYDFSTAQKATAIPHLNRLRAQQNPSKSTLLDDDVQIWLSTQDNTTKQCISEMIRQIMTLKQATA